MPEEISTTQCSQLMNGKVVDGIEFEEYRGCIEEISIKFSDGTTLVIVGYYDRNRGDAYVAMRAGTHEVVVTG